MLDQILKIVSNRFNQSLAIVGFLIFGFSEWENLRTGDE